MTDATQATCTLTVIMMKCTIRLPGKARSQSIQTKLYTYHKYARPAESLHMTKLNRMQRNNSNVNHNHSVWPVNQNSPDNTGTSDV